MIICIFKEKGLLEAIDYSTVSTMKDDKVFTIITLNIKNSEILFI